MRGEKLFLSKKKNKLCNIFWDTTTKKFFFFYKCLHRIKFYFFSEKKEKFLIFREPNFLTTTLLPGNTNAREVSHRAIHNFQISKFTKRFLGYVFAKPLVQTC